MLGERVALSALGIQDDNLNDYRNRAFVADEEPPIVKCDAWIRAKISVEQHPEELNAA